MEKLAAPAEPRIVTETMDVTQGKLAMGFRCGTEDVPAMILANLMFGGSSNSKLFLNVREKLSLCYYASSTYTRSKGIVTVSSGIETKDYDRAREEIMRQLQALQRGEWEDWELTAARSAMLTALSSLDDSQGALENYYLGQAATEQGEPPEELARLISEVTSERIRAAAQSVALDTVYFLRGREEN
jgi:predicted Zn-dependent peptidase